MLHYFHTGDPRLALPLRIAVLYEGVLTVLKDQELPPSALSDHLALVTAVDLFMESIAQEVVVGHEPPLAKPEEGDLKADGRSRPTGDASPVHRERVRRLVKQFVHHDGWRWRDVQARRAPEDGKAPAASAG